MFGLSFIILDGEKTQAELNTRNLLYLLVQKSTFFSCVSSPTHFHNVDT